MVRTLVTAVACGSLLFALACKPEEKPAPGGESTGAATSSLEDAAPAVVEEGQESADDVAAQVEEGTAQAVAKAGAAVEAATVSVEELAAVAKSSFSMENLKELAGSLDADSLKKVATRIGEEIRGQSDVITKIQTELADLDVTRALEATQIESKLTEAKNLLAQLKDKLEVVVDQLKAKGIDVSQFTRLLEG